MYGMQSISFDNKNYYAHEVTIGDSLGLPWLQHHRASQRVGD